ncbi:MAG: hypothetical protein JKY94_09145 [Rhodobacteraceae bacterium]|nr:hypothetical protein [Paracoccaceae bacterium]
MIDLFTALNRSDMRRETITHVLSTLRHNRYWLVLAVLIVGTLIGGAV